MLGRLSVGGGEEAVILADAAGVVRFGTRPARTSRTQASAGNRLTVRTETRPWVTYVPDGSLFSGSMPAGSTQIDVRAPIEPKELVVAGGAYLALLPGHVLQKDAYVVFRDDDGRIVPWPLKHELKREPVTDTDIPCPACQEVAWDAVEIRTAATADRYRQRGLVCGACGLHWGGWTDAGRRRSGVREHQRNPDPFAEINGRELDVKVVSSAHFPVYAMAPGLAEPPHVAQWGGAHGPDITSVAISHVVPVGGRRVEVQVSSTAPSDNGDAEDEARVVGAVAGKLWTDLFEHDATLRSLSSQARSLRLEQLRIDAQERAGQARRQEIEIPVDGEGIVFSVARERSGRWCAIATINAARVSVTSDGYEPNEVQLVTITDPTEYFPAEVDD